MKLLVLAAAAVAALAVMTTVSAAPTPSAMTFEEFKDKYNKVYESAEEEARRAAIFQESLDFIEKHNAEAAAGMHTYLVGVNEFADLTREEFRQHHVTRLPFDDDKRDPVTATLHLDEHAVHAADSNGDSSGIDWRKRGAVTPVRNQGQCGNPAIFAAVEAVEGMHAISSGNLVELSTQQVIDCSGTPGCSGGSLVSFFKYIARNGGLDSAADYPTSGAGGQCNKAKEARHVAKVGGYSVVPPRNETKLAAAVFKMPVAVAIEADTPSFQMYTSGVYSGPCGTQLDHAVLVVGYTDEYWIVKNSWGASWGDQGYIMMKRGVGAAGICGITLDAMYPTATNATVATLHL
ncbi:cysteine protease [Salpingoeca rosetta]|uniref:Cysteine protease n=1 Tax=Salpingoeca rosetta (strain ATCC 50818 / BSB-021) TaxID=946362 RepID=F2UJD2_SALR5|nr:cysteine protease [Salpingoeca rosetta]EGD77231.1 cysteine protease [Salpingoeca rosetta]|eukprot:XP_004990575.1 cysteine protease [Salpingoeca rosetta]